MDCREPNRSRESDNRDCSLSRRESTLPQRLSRKRVSPPIPSHRRARVARTKRSCVVLAARDVPGRRILRGYRSAFFGSSSIQPLVSTVIPAHNADKTIDEAIRSVLTQTFLSQEIIVVDDGSVDNTRLSVEAFGDRVTYVGQKQGGAAAARNTGIRVARGEFIAFLDADDVWLPQKLERQLAVMLANPGIGAVQCGARYVDNVLRTLEVRTCVTDGDVLMDTLRFRNLPAFMSALVMRRSCLDRIGPLDSSLEILEDWDMAIKAARFCNLASLADALVLYRVHPGNRSRNVDIHVAPGLSILGRLYADPTIPQRIRGAERQVYGTFYRMLSGGYFRSRRLSPFLRWCALSLLRDPGQAAYMVAYPLRLLRRRMSPGGATPTKHGGR